MHGWSSIRNSLSHVTVCTSISSQLWRHAPGCPFSRDQPLFGGGWQKKFLYQSHYHVWMVKRWKQFIPMSLSAPAIVAFSSSSRHLKACALDGRPFSRDQPFCNHGWMVRLWWRLLAAKKNPGRIPPFWSARVVITAKRTARDDGRPTSSKVYIFIFDRTTKIFADNFATLFHVIIKFF